MSGHLPFEDWLLGDEPLTPDRQASLDEHLAGCQACRALADAWGEVEKRLRESPAALPAAGFGRRWVARLQAERARTRRRQVTAAVVLTTGGALVALGLYALQTGLSLASVGQLLEAVLRTSLGALMGMRLGWEFASALGTNLSPVIPAAWWLGATTAAAGLVALWFASVYRFAVREAKQGAKR